MMLQSHTYIGGFIAALLVIRVVLLFAVKRPAPADAGNAFLNFVAKATHVLLYLFLLGMALSGLGLFQQADLPAVFSAAKPYPSDAATPLYTAHQRFQQKAGKSLRRREPICGPLQPLPRP